MEQKTLHKNLSICRIQIQGERKRSMITEWRWVAKIQPASIKEFPKKEMVSGSEAISQSIRDLSESQKEMLWRSKCPHKILGKINERGLHLHVSPWKCVLLIVARMIIQNRSLRRSFQALNCLMHFLFGSAPLHTLLPGFRPNWPSFWCLHVPCTCWH